MIDSSKKVDQKKSIKQRTSGRKSNSASEESLWEFAWLDFNPPSLVASEDFGWENFVLVFFNFFFSEFKIMDLQRCRLWRFVHAALSFIDFNACDGSWNWKLRCLGCEERWPVPEVWLRQAVHGQQGRLCRAHLRLRHFPLLSQSWG